MPPAFCAALPIYSSQAQVACCGECLHPHDIKALLTAGATLPMFSIIFGDVLNALGGSPTIEELVHQVNKVSVV